MSNTINHQMIIGRLGSDIEVKVSSGGSAFCVFSLSWDVYAKGENKSEWQRVVAFGKSAEFLGKYAGKGDLIMAVGDVVINRYTSRDGVEKEQPQLSAQTVKIVGSKRAKATTEEAAGGKKGDSYAPLAAPAGEAYDDDIPF